MFESNTSPCKKETNMVLASMTTDKIGLIFMTSHENPLETEVTLTGLNIYFENHMKKIQLTYLLGYRNILQNSRICHWLSLTLDGQLSWQLQPWQSPHTSSTGLLATFHFWSGSWRASTSKDCLSYVNTLPHTHQAPSLTTCILAYASDISTHHIK